MDPRERGPCDIGSPRRGRFVAPGDDHETAGGELREQRLRSQSSSGASNSYVSTSNTPPARPSFDHGRQVDAARRRAPGPARPGIPWATARCCGRRCAPRRGPTSSATRANSWSSVVFPTPPAPLTCSATNGGSSASSAERKSRSPPHDRRSGSAAPRPDGRRCARRRGFLRHARSRSLGEWRQTGFAPWRFCGAAASASAAARTRCRLAAVGATSR